MEELSDILKTITTEMQKSLSPRQQWASPSLWREEPSSL